MPSSHFSVVHELPLQLKENEQKIRKCKISTSSRTSHLRFCDDKERDAADENENDDDADDDVDDDK